MAADQQRCTLLTWNVQWASKRSRRFPLIREAIDRIAADVIVLTEGSPSVLPDHGHVVTSSADFGYSPADRGRRKVLLWSRWPWCDVDLVGSPVMPGGRFVAATTETEMGPVWIIGVCIPWRDAHVRTGRKDRRPWEDHLKYLDGLSEYLPRLPQSKVALVVGDFNQRVPPGKAPASVGRKLVDAFDGWQIGTAGVTSSSGELLIDHAAIRPADKAVKVRVLERTTVDGRPCRTITV
jgi:endonuclease/exonuclease/phosphatase family metal-dependent hydrolase